MTDRTIITVDGYIVNVDVERGEDGPRIVLSGANCNLEGDAPGEYLLTPLTSAGDVLDANTDRYES